MKTLNNTSLFIQFISVIVVATMPLSAIALNKTICVNHAGNLDDSCDEVVRTIAEVNALTESELEGGDQVLFKRGEIWREQLTVPVSGSPGLPIRFSAYGSQSTENPKIAWDLNLFNIYNAGFENFTGVEGDSETDIFESFFGANADGGNYIDAIESEEFGRIAANMHSDINSTASTQTYLRRRVHNLQADTTYYFGLYSKYAVGSPTGLRVRIHHEGTKKEVMSDGTWGATETPHWIELNLESTTESGWQERGISFTTESGDASAIRVDIVARAADTTVAVDNVYLAEGSVRDTNIDTSGVKETSGILIDSKNHIEIDSIDVAGPGDNVYSFNSTYGIDVAGTATDVKVSHLDVTDGSGIGIRSAHTTQDVRFEWLDVYDNENTGLYMNSRLGTNFVLNNKVHDNGNNLKNLDRGGIGVQGANVFILNNEVWRNGHIDDKGDYEISVVKATSPVFIKNNYVHDCLQGCIQIAEGGHGSVIAYNVISGFGEGSYIDTSLNGSAAGIRIGGGGIPPGATTTYANDMQVYNNVVYGGKQNPASTERSAALFVGKFDNAGLQVKNNIFYGNEGESVYIDYSATYSNFEGYNFDHNLYEESLTSEKFVWKANHYSTLVQWKAAAFNDNFEFAEFSTTQAPLFVDAVNDDFHISGGSPAINTGTNVGLLADFDGNPIAVSEDMGAFEFLDYDNDSFDIPGDCDDSDSSIYPGADDIYNDGIIQNCNNAIDPSITVFKATYSYKKDQLIVEAVTPAGQADQLTVNGSDMQWSNKSGGRWIYKVSPIANPGTVTIRGSKGYIDWLL